MLNSKNVCKSSSVEQKKKEGRHNLNDSQVFFNENNVFRNELFLMMEQNGLSYTSLASEFSVFLNKKGAQIKAVQGEKKNELSIFEKYIKGVKKEEMTDHADFDWTGHFKKFMTGKIASLGYGEVCLLKQFFEEYENKKEVQY